MPMVVPFTIRTTFSIHFYEQVDGCWIETYDIPGNICDEVSQMFTNFGILKYFLEYVSFIVKKSVKWTGKSLKFEIDTYGEIHHFRDPEYYCYRHLVDTIDFHERTPTECLCNINGRLLRFRFSDVDVKLLYESEKQKYIPLESYCIE